MQVVASASMRGARVGKIVAFTDSGKGSGKPIKFRIKQKIQFGQHFAVVGSQQLGEWNPQHALELKWEEGDVWSAETVLDLNPATKNPIELKFVIVESENEIKWQPGSNVVLDVPEDASEVLVEAKWENPEATVIKPIKKTSVVEKKVVEKTPVKKATATISSVAAPDVARSNIMRKAASPISTAPAAAAKAATTSMSLAEIEKMTLPKIKEIMVKMGLETTGKKADLIARIRSYMQT
jgi:hypothetical protein